MKETGRVKGTLTGVRRRVSQAFWKFWDALPISPAARATFLVFIFRYASPLVAWSASYRNWKEAADRLTAQMARIAELRQGLETGPAGRVPRYSDPSALPRPETLLARAVAFYLPQFHAIPENDLWWGKGFTEWTNVCRARPQFQGHRQPRRPGELGYYDLMRTPSTRRRQAALAQQYGLEGFCFYFYWFGGKTLLEAPVREWANDPEISFPFCLCWANESWSRRWDGREDQRLISQHHSPDDDIAFISHISEYLQSDKYLKVDSRPLVVVYRPDKLPDAKASAARWRDWCRKNGIGEIFLAYTLSFAKGEPDEYGFDAAIEFPPNNMGLRSAPEMVVPTGDSFDARIYDLTELAVRPAESPSGKQKLFRGVTPQWDNTARRMNHAAIMLDGGPAVYERWLRKIASETALRVTNPAERLVFINAWNEWAEGAYLEPDADHGYAWLAATRAALTCDPDALVEPADLVPADPMVTPSARPKIIVVVHDLWKNGAQIHSLFLVATLREKFGYDVTTIAGGDGPLYPNFEWYGPVIRLQRGVADAKNIAGILTRLKLDGYERAIVNSSAGGWLVPYLAEADIESIGLVHEMPDIIRNMKLEEGLEAFDRHCRHVVFSSGLVCRQTAKEILQRDWNNPVIQPQGMYKGESLLNVVDKEVAAAQLRQRLGLPEDAIIVVGVGFGDFRKGVDVFCHWAIASAAGDSLLHFIWVGDLHTDMQPVCHAILANAGPLAENVHLVGFQDDTASFYKAAAAYALSSREDPFPSTVLEALSCGAPAFIVEGTTGLTELSANNAICVLPDAEPETFSASLAALLSSADELRDAAASGMDLIRRSFGFRSFTGELLRLAGAQVPRISVVVPNYNYARHLPHRIATILCQELPVWEIIFLDDASTDESIEVAERLLKDCGINYRIIKNSQNSGSVFAQWKKGVELARGDLVWIAEADDWASARFTKVAARAFEDAEAVLSYTQSNQVSGDSEILCPHYLDYVSDIDRERWRRPFVNDGTAELNDGLSVKNTIPNVSGVLFRRDVLAQVLSEHMDEICSYRVAGDWCVYAHIARMGKIAFDPRPLNYHRRHTESVTISRFTKAEWDEIARMQSRVTELADVSPENRKRATDYLEELRKRL